MSMLLDLIDGHDILHEDQDIDIVVGYTEQLKANGVLHTCSEKMLQSLIASINTCLHSKKSNGKTNGLVALQALCMECSDPVFLEQGSSWLKAVHPMIQKCQVGPGFLRLACSALRTIVRRAPQFPEISRYLTTIVAPIIEGLLNMTGKCSGLENDAVLTIQVLFHNYPGSCGSNQGKVEKFLLANMTSQSKLSSKTLAQCLALMPRLGGGGKEGIHHKANFVTMFQRLTFTMEDVLANILSISVNFQPSSSNVRSSEPFQMLTSPSKDLFSKAAFHQNQFDILCQCISELLLVPFPHPKAVRPGLLFNVIFRVFENHLSDLAKSAGNESKILLFVLPQLMTSSMRVVMTLLRVCKQSLALYVPEMTKLVVEVLSDLRNFTEPWDSLRVATYELVIELCESLEATSGLDQTELTSYILSDILPPDQDIALLKAPRKKNTKKPVDEPILQNGKRMKSLLLMEASLKALGVLLKTTGPLLDQSVMKQIQCVLLGLGMEQEFAKSLLPDIARRHLYETLVVLLEKGHCKASHSLQLFSHLFQAAASRESGSIKYVCQHGLSLCTNLIHPLRSSLHLDLPLQVKTIDEIKADLMKVHVFYMETSGRSLNSLSIKPSVEPALGQVEAPSEVVPAETIHPEANDASREIHAMKEKLKERSQKRPFQEEASVKDNKDYPDLEALPSREESDRIVNEAYDFSRDSIYIPEAVKNRVILEEQPKPKVARIDESDDSEEFLDTETMLKDFVPA